MAILAEVETHRVIVQPRGQGEKLDIYRLVGGRTVASEDFENTEDADAKIRHRIQSSLDNIRESKIFLGLNAAVAAILFVEALRRRSKVLTAVGLAAGAGALYANSKREIHTEELDWLEKEENAVELFDDGLTVVS